MRIRVPSCVPHRESRSGASKGLWGREGTKRGHDGVEMVPRGARPSGEQH